MYLDFYNLKYEPFSLSPDPRFLFFATSHKEALAHLRYGLIQHKGFVVVIGEVGTGKTTLIHSLMSEIPEKVITSFVSNPVLTRDEFFFLLAKKYGLGDVKNKADFLVRFSQFLEQAHRKKENVVLIIDEAHCLPKDILEEIRLLSNLETPQSKLINIILTGQPEFAEILNDPNFRALKQRITLRYHLEPLNLNETAAYVQLRLAKAGARDVGIFTDGALKKVYMYSKGIPRVINLLCDHALLTGFVKETKIIDDTIIRECAKELDCSGGNREGRGGHSSKERTSKRKHLLFWVIVSLLLLASAALCYVVFKNSEEYRQVLEKVLEYFR